MALHLWADNRITHSIAFPGQTHYNNADFSWVHLFLIFLWVGRLRGRRSGRRRRRGRHLLRGGRVREGGGEPVGPRLYGEGPLVEVLVAQQEGAAEDVVAHARVVLEAVGRLLEHADLADHVGDLENNKGGGNH